MYKRNRASLCPLILIGEADGSSSVSSTTSSLCRIGSFPLLFYLVEMVDLQMKKCPRYSLYHFQKMGEMEHIKLSPPHCLALETFFEDVKGVARITVLWALHQDIII